MSLRSFIYFSLRLLAIVLCLDVALAQGQRRHKVPWRTLLPGHNLTIPHGTQNGSFEQLISHDDPSLGTFPQRYWWNTDHWGGPGHPVVLLTPGEENAEGYTGYCTNATISGMIAQRIGAAAIVIEHRYWGTSSPYKVLSTANMEHLTLDNSMQDLVYFAKTAKLPFADGLSSNAEAVPWVLVGGSYPGALTSYIASLHPGVFWAYLASSAPVQVITDFWQYFVPIQNGMPKNCSTDVAKVIEYMDNVVQHGSPHEIQNLKQEFGLADVSHNDDFMVALESGPWLWQDSSDTAPSTFQVFCDYVENVANATSNTSIPGPAGVGSEKALHGYATWMREVQIPSSCPDGNISACFGTYDPKSIMYTDTSLDNEYERQWMWVLCNEPFEFWQDGAPANRPTLVSRYSSAKYWRRQCGLYFPPGPNGETYGLARGATTDALNARTGGWNMLQERDISRIVMTNGEFDPWRSAGVASEFRPGGPLHSSTKDVFFNLIPGGVHCYDFIAAYGTANAAVAKAQQAEIEQIAEWVGQWKNEHARA